MTDPYRTPAVPNIETHIARTFDEMPKEDVEIVERPDLPVPSLWQKAVSVKRKADGKLAVVAKIDHAMMMFRAFFPNEGDVDPDTGKPKGKFSSRTEWEQCAQWDVEVTYSPKELARQAAQAQLDVEIAKLDKTSMGRVMVLCDDPDPAKALAKLHVLLEMGALKVSPEAAQAVVESRKGGK